MAVSLPFTAQCFTHHVLYVEGLLKLVLDLLFPLLPSIMTMINKGMWCLADVQFGVFNLGNDGVGW